MDIKMLLLFTPLYTVFDAESIYLVEETNRADWLSAHEKCSERGNGNLHFISGNDEIQKLSQCHIQNRIWVGNLRLVTPYLRFSGCFKESLAKGRVLDLPNGTSVSRCYMKCNKTLPIAIQDYRCVCFNYSGWIYSKYRTNICKTCSRAPNEICGCQQMLAVYERASLQDKDINENGLCVTKRRNGGRTIYRGEHCSNMKYGICESGRHVNESWIANAVSCIKDKSVLKWQINESQQGEFILNTRQYSHVINSRDLQPGVLCNGKRNNENEMKCLCGYIDTAKMNVIYTTFCYEIKRFKFSSFLCSRNVSGNGVVTRQCSINTSKTIHKNMEEITSFYWNGCLEETTHYPTSSVIGKDNDEHSESTSRLNTEGMSVKGQSPEHSLTNILHESSTKLLTGPTIDFAQNEVHSRENEKEVTATLRTLNRWSPPKTKTSVKTGAIVGAVIGSVAILSLLGFIIIWKWRRSAKSERENSNGVSKVDFSSKSGEQNVEASVNIFAEKNNAPLYAVVSKPKPQSVGMNDKSGDHETKARDATVTDEYYVSNDEEYDRLGTKRKHNRTTSSDNEYNIADARTFDINIYSLAKSIDADGHVDGAYDVALNVSAEMESAPGNDTYDHSSPL